ncbi:universal stress protein [Mesorhizobium sp.]|uniref:universal stress protein n=1 Tax=Mesorhizobium sp. TaxID=1871066 RepID=UPI000FE4EDE7|nr:universal stress protein [Mesorhizobium sp.]RWM24643.1 MAG: universal stress protein [Mesorhizobium sp.]TJV53472.1 MAG: universal stress protein [Mesorhizobium sp.]
MTEMKLVLCATDGSEHAYKALEFAADLAQSKNAELLVVHVQRVRGSERISREMQELERIEQVRVTEAGILRSVAERIASEGAKVARTKGVSGVESLVVEGDPAREIVETAKTRGADAIVIGSRGLGDLQGLLLGSVSHKVAHLAPCTTIIVH